jgi:hypothetical protein
MQDVYKLDPVSPLRLRPRARPFLREDAMTAAIFVISINLLLIGSLAIRSR